MLNRVVEWREDGVAIEADQRHVEIAAEEMGLVGANGVATPGVRVREEEEETEGTGELSRERARTFRGVAARLNFLAMDRGDLPYSTKELCRDMSRPTERAWEKLKRAVRYLVGKPRVVLVFRWQRMPKKLVIWVDSDHGGCHKTRKSTSGGVMMWGAHCLKVWSSTQSVIALSSGEAEYYALLKGASVGLGMRGLMGEMGVGAEVELRSDSSAGLGVANRRGVGRVKHVQICYLWLQEKVERGEVCVVKVGGLSNWADIQTKYVDGARLWDFLARMGWRQEEGRSDLTPGVARDAGSGRWNGEWDEGVWE